MAEGAAVAAVAAAVIGASATVYSSTQAQKAAKANRPQPLPKPDLVPDQAKLDAQRNRRMAGQGVGDTNLTGPLGLNSDAGGSRKTLLGM